MAKSKHGREDRRQANKKRLRPERTGGTNIPAVEEVEVKSTGRRVKRRKMQNKEKKKQEEGNKEPSFFEMAKAASADADTDLASLQQQMEANAEKMKERASKAAIVAGISRPSCNCNRALTRCCM